MLLPAALRPPSLFSGVPSQPGWGKLEQLPPRAQQALVLRPSAGAWLGRKKVTWQGPTECDIWAARSARGKVDSRQEMKAGQDTVYMQKDREHGCMDREGVCGRP